MGLILPSQVKILQRAMVSTHEEKGRNASPRQAEDSLLWQLLSLSASFAGAEESRL